MRSTLLATGAALVAAVLSTAAAHGPKKALKPLHLLALALTLMVADGAAASGLVLHWDHAPYGYLYKGPLGAREAYIIFEYGVENTGHASELNTLRWHAVDD